MKKRIKVLKTLSVSTEIFRKKESEKREAKF